ncbi:MAG: hypothetical protein EBS51_11985, partial [Planctomycetia bacterium]|nr:hypothetical protein [Planctomycetia bacterium]
VASRGLTGPAAGTYTVGQSLDFVVRFSEAVVVGGTPQIALSGLNAARQATYVAGSGSDALTFRYVVQAGDTLRGKKGLRLAKAIALSAGSSIADSAGNRASLQVTSAALKGIRVTGTEPATSRIAGTVDTPRIATGHRLRTTFATLG